MNLAVSIPPDVQCLFYHKICVMYTVSVPQRCAVLLKLHLVTGMQIIDIGGFHRTIHRLSITTDDCRKRSGFLKNPKWESKHNIWAFKSDLHHNSK